MNRKVNEKLRWLGYKSWGYWRRWWNWRRSDRV